MHSQHFRGLAALLFAPVLWAVAAPAAAQSVDLKTYAGSAEVTAMIAKAKKDIVPGRPILLQPLLMLSPYKAFLEYRVAPVPPAVHETEAELFYVVQGSGTITIGGTLEGQKRVNATNLGGTSLTGGVPRKVGKGDFFIIPENTPHGFNAVDRELVLMSIHMARGGAPK